jgi:Fic family protein
MKWRLAAGIKSARRENISAYRRESEISAQQSAQRNILKKEKWREESKARRMAQQRINNAYMAMKTKHREMK